MLINISSTKDSPRCTLGGGLSSDTKEEIKKSSIGVY